MDDLYYIVVLLFVPVVLFSLWAQAAVSSRFKRYSMVRNTRHITGRDTALMILNAQGIGGVRIESVAGNLSDHYDPARRTVRLSGSVFARDSVAAAAVAAHECGHAIQHATGDAMLKLRSALYPVVSVSSSVSWILLIAGILFSVSGLVLLGIIAFSMVVLFQLITLPMEFDASRRALVCLQTTVGMGAEELRGAKKVLWACAMTYVASLAMGILQLLRLISIFGMTRRD